MDSDEESDEIKFWKGSPGTVILINAFGNCKQTVYPTAHAAACRLVRQYLRLSGSRNVSVCVYGIEEPTISSFDLKSVIEIFPLKLPTLEDFKKLRDFDISSYPEAKELKLSDVLWHCNKTFLNFKKLISTRTIIILTELHTAPIIEDHKPTLKKVKDLIESNIDIKLINISNEEYTIDPFYEHFLLEVNKGQHSEIPPPMWDSKEIEKVMHQDSHRHLALAKLDFEIGNGFSIAVTVYTLLKRNIQQKKVNLERDTNALVNSVTKTMKVSTSNNETEESDAKEVPLLKSETLYYQNYGGENVIFTEKEVHYTRNPFGRPMIKLLGFKPTESICKEKWYTKMTYFLFPNESSIEGSTIVFKALHKACEEMSVVAICIFCTRVNTKSIIVALSPTRKPLGIDVDIGFNVITLPYVESVRDMPNIQDDETIEVDEASKSVMNGIINHMKFDFKADVFENPKLQSEYRALESIALEEEYIEPFIDTTHPDQGIIDNIRADLFEEIFGPFATLSIKRAASASETSNKKSKVENIDEDLLQQRIDSQNINLYNVAQLREILKFKHNPKMPALTGLKKTDLVNLVYQFCS